MARMITKAVLGFTLGASVLVATAPTAEAQRYRDRHHRGDGGAAIVAGIAGLAIGAALASDSRYDYDRRYYRERGYYPTDGYYYRENYRRHRGYNNCSVRRHYDPSLGRSVRVRYCR
ncbi:MAG: hypothetical protein EOP60_09800 [Sphingomonadales bacterium]|nr:MAG: hypothetical protein EOP60_09800 [Sphingomonadales bacterium]